MTAEDTAAGGELDEDDGARLPPRSSSAASFRATNHRHFPPSRPYHQSRNSFRAAPHIQYSMESVAGGSDSRWIPPQRSRSGRHYPVGSASGGGEEQGWQLSRPPPHDERWSPSSSGRPPPEHDYNGDPPVGVGWGTPVDDGGGGECYDNDDDYLKQASSLSYHAVKQWRHHPVLVEVAPGIRAPLRGSDETWQALQDDFYVPGLCWICDETVFVIQDAAFVLCPDCRTVCPMEGDFVDRIAAGVGLGFKYETLVRWQDELQRRRRLW